MTLHAFHDHIIGFRHTTTFTRLTPNTSSSAQFLMNSLVLRCNCRRTAVCFSFSCTICSTCWLPVDTTAAGPAVPKLGLSEKAPAPNGFCPACDCPYDSERATPLAAGDLGGTWGESVPAGEGPGTRPRPAAWVLPCTRSAWRSGAEAYLPVTVPLSKAADRADLHKHTQLRFRSTLTAGRHKLSHGLCASLGVCILCGAYAQ